MFDGPSTGILFPTNSPDLSKACKRENILRASNTDWMEWQAGFGCSAFLMPAGALREVVRGFLEEANVSIAQFAVESAEGEALIDTVISQFQVSRDAARVRLLQRGALVDFGNGETLF